MDFFEGLFKKVKNSKKTDEPEGEPYEFCPKCDANLTLQKGYRNEIYRTGSAKVAVKCLSIRRSRVI